MYSNHMCRSNKRLNVDVKLHFFTEILVTLILRGFVKIFNLFFLHNVDSELGIDYCLICVLKAPEAYQNTSTNDYSARMQPELCYYE